MRGEHLLGCEQPVQRRLDMHFELRRSISERRQRRDRRDLSFAQAEARRQ
jgi:hypothetical protein